MRILIGNQQRQKTLAGKLKEIIENVVTEAAVKYKLAENTEVSVTLVDDEAIRELNRKYRNIDSATDVLSFAFDEPLPGEDISYVNTGETHLLGEIIISLERADAQAKDYGHSLEREIAYLTVHGLLHLLGFEHQDEGETRTMRQHEEQILHAMNFIRD